MSRFVKRAGEGASSVDLSTCALNTNQPITTSSSFCGSGRTLCDTSWDLVCCFYNTACSGSFGSSLRIELPTDCYSQFDFTICGVCLSCNFTYIYVSNSTCACTCCGAGFEGCCYQYLCNAIVPFLPYFTNCQGIPAFGDNTFRCSLCPSTLGFNLQLTKIASSNGIYLSYCSNSFNPPNGCQIYNQYRASINGSCAINTAWNRQCASTCRFTAIILCAYNGCNMCYTPEFNFNLYGRKDNNTCYTTWS